MVAELWFQPVDRAEAASIADAAFGLVVQLQAYTARRAERSAEEQAREQHLAEQARQREHEQMLSQILR